MILLNECYRWMEAKLPRPRFCPQWGQSLRAPSPICSQIFCIFCIDISSSQQRSEHTTRQDLGNSVQMFNHQNEKYSDLFNQQQHTRYPPSSIGKHKSEDCILRVKIHQNVIMLEIKTLHSNNGTTSRFNEGAIDVQQVMGNSTWLMLTRNTLQPLL